MKKFSIIIFFLIGICSMNAQNIPDLFYFDVDESSNEYIVLNVPSLPEPKGNSGTFRYKPEFDIDRLFSDSLQLIMESYFTDKDWDDKKDWLKKYGPSYTLYFDKNLKIFAYSILLKPEVFTQMSEDCLKGFGEKLMKMDLHPYFEIEEQYKDTFTWGAVHVWVNRLYK